jgi:hypothetical protein
MGTSDLFITCPALTRLDISLLLGRLMVCPCQAASKMKRNFHRKQFPSPFLVAPSYYEAAMEHCVNKLHPRQLINVCSWTAGGANMHLLMSH